MNRRAKPELYSMKLVSEGVILRSLLEAYNCNGKPYTPPWIMFW